MTTPTTGPTTALLDVARAYWDAGLTPLPRVPGDPNPHFLTPGSDIKAIGWGSYKVKQPRWA